MKNKEETESTIYFIIFIVILIAQWFVLFTDLFPVGG